MKMGGIGCWGPCLAGTCMDLLAGGAGLGVLAGLAVAGWVHGSDDVRTAGCLENLRRLTQAWSQHASDHGGVLVNNYSIGPTEGTVADRSYETWANNVLDWTLGSQNTNAMLMAEGPLAPYLGREVRVFKCPADTFLSAQQVAAGWSGRVRSYAMNGFMGRAVRTEAGADGRGLNSFFGAYRQFRQWESIPQPAERLVFLDEHPDSINEGFFLLTPGASSQWFDFPTSLHDRGAAFSYADGHAARHAWSAPESIPAVRYRFPPRIDLVGDALADLRWLTDRMTVPSTHLTLRRAPHGVRVLWSQVSDTYRLESSTAISPGNWTRVDAVVGKSVGQKEAALALEGEARVFRLKSP